MPIKNVTLAFLTADCVVQLTDLTISSSVWPMSHLSSRNLHCGTTPSVVSTRALLDSVLQSLSSATAALLPTDTSSFSFR